MTRAARSIVAIAAVWAVVTPLAAQGPPRAGLSPAAVRSVAAPAVRVDSIAPSHWKEGAIAGGLFGVLVDGLLLAVSQSCDVRNCGRSATIYILPPLLFAGIGSLIGSFSPRK